MNEAAVARKTKQDLPPQGYRAKAILKAVSRIVAKKIPVFVPAAVKADSKSPLIETFPIAAYLPDLVAPMATAGLITRTDLMRAVATETAAVKIVAQKTDEFLNGSPFATFRGRTGPTSVARIVAAATATPVQAIYASFNAGRIDPDKIQAAETAARARTRKGRIAPIKTRKKSTKLLTDYPLNDSHKILVARLVEGGIATRAALVKSLHPSTAAISQGVDKLLRGKIFSYGWRPSDIARRVFALAELPLPPAPAHGSKPAVKKDRPFRPLQAARAPRSVSPVRPVPPAAPRTQSTTATPVRKSSEPLSDAELHRRFRVDRMADRVTVAAPRIRPPSENTRAVYHEFGPRRLAEGVDIFDFLKTEPYWKAKLEVGVTLGNLVGEMGRKDPTAAREFVDRCAAIPTFMNENPANPEALGLRRLEKDLVARPLRIDILSDLQTKTQFMKNFMRTSQPYASVLNPVSLPRHATPGPS